MAFEAYLIITLVLQGTLLHFCQGQQQALRSQYLTIQALGLAQYL